MRVVRELLGIVCGQPQVVPELLLVINELLRVVGNTSELKVVY